MITQKANFGALLSRKIANVLERTRQIDYTLIYQSVSKAKTVFLCGAGRSGEVTKFFAMRLLHTGLKTNIVGDVTTPSITAEDLLIGISNSGTTQTTKDYFEKAKSIGAQRILVTHFDSMESAIAELADIVIPLKITEEDKGFFMLGNDINLAPMGTLFELSSLLFFEGVISAIIQAQKIQESAMKKIHSNLE